jgi:hypothetical protein
MRDETDTDAKSGRIILARAPTVHMECSQKGYNRIREHHLPRDENDECLFTTTNLSLLLAM